MNHRQTAPITLFRRRISGTTRTGPSHGRRAWRVAGLLSLGWMCLAGGEQQTLGGALRVTGPRCEYAANPLGLETRSPRLSWVLESRRRGQVQTAYQVLVASTPGLLRQDQGDLWDSGRVDSDRSVQIVYSGQPLRSRQRCHWKVRVWDGDGNPSAYSRPAFWEMGLLEAGDRQAEWIGLELPWTGQERWPDARWIWFPDGEAKTEMPKKRCYFRRVIDLPEGKSIRRAIFRLAADDYFALWVNRREAGRSVGKPYSWKILNEMDVTALLAPGTNLITVAATNTQETAGLLGQMVVEFESGPPLSLQTDGSWKVSQRLVPGWQTLGFDDSSWDAARELARPGGAPWAAADYPPMGPASYLRKTVSLPQEIRQARLYASALGVYEFYINGRSVAQDVFNPGWTDYNCRVPYHAYDVTSLLRSGSNALGIALGDGWYAGFLGLGGRARYGILPLAWAQLEVELADGSTQTILTGESWKAATGPILQSDMLMGETYDARKENPGWTEPGFDEAGWQEATVRHVPATLVAAGDEPVRRTRTLRPRSLAEPRPGQYVFDLGQNMVGRVRLRVRGEAGTRVVLRHAEMLNGDGTLYTANLREAKCVDQYILKGEGEELYEPHFTFHGFRYVELTGYPGRPSLDSVAGVVLHSDLPTSGSFECSNPLINQLQSNITWSQRGNFLSIPTDCPQRDERLGWTGDAQVFIRTAAFNMEVARFFTKWIQDLEDAQQPDGAFTDVAPFVAARSGTAAWGDAGVICPWAIYQVYDDARILKEHYAAGGRWIDYLQANSTNLLRPAAGYGDWLSVGADTPKDLLATAYFAHSTRLMARMARVLGRVGDGDRYEQLHDQIKAAFNQAYVEEDARISGETQTGYVLALAFDLLPAERRAAAARRLVEDIAAKDGHLSTGFCGVGLLLPVLTQAGHLDTAYQLLLQETFPSWLYSIKEGATTIWERWDGWTREKGFQTAWMNSFNHYSLGSVGAWLAETVAGIGLDPSFPGYKHLIIHPQPGGGLTWAKGEYRSIRGRILSNWQIDEGQFRLEVVIPANTTARVYLPIAEPGQVREGRKPASRAEGVEFLHQENGGTVYAVGSGHYRFHGPLAGR